MSPIDQNMNAFGRSRLHTLMVRRSMNFEVRLIIIYFGFFFLVFFNGYWGEVGKAITDKVRKVYKAGYLDCILRVGNTISWALGDSR